MSLRTPKADGLAIAPNAVADANNPAASVAELQSHFYWGRFASFYELPNAVDNPAGAPAYELMRPGDLAYAQGDQSLWQLIDRGTISLGDAIWGSLNVTLPTSAFGEIQVSDLVPFVQFKFTNGILPDTMRPAHVGSGTITQANGLAVISTGAAAGGLARLTSLRYARYGPGQGIEARFTGVFTAGVAGTTQWVGIGDAEDALAFGFDGVDFGVLRRTGGQVEIRTLTVTAGAAGAGVITITLNGGPGVAVAIGGVLTIGEVAAAIAAADYSNEGGGFRASYAGNRVIFKSLIAEPRGGAYSFAAGATGAAGAFAATAAGVVATDVVVPKANWSGRNVPNIDPTLGNVFRVVMQWLGYGMITFEVENPATGKFVEAHKIAYANTSVSPTLRQPEMPLLVESYNGAVASDIVARSASMGIFNLGPRITSGPIHSPIGSKSIGTSYTLLLAVRIKSLNFTGITNKIDTLVRALSLGNNAGKICTFRVWLNPTIVGSPTWSDVDAASSRLEVSTDGTSVSGGSLVASFTVGGLQGEVVNFEPGEWTITPDSLWVIDAAVASGAADILTASLRVVEDV